jgi:hypothetical protein
LLSTEAAEDAWANPKGTQATIEAILPIYELLGVNDPPIAMHVRPGEHNQNAEDYRALMDYADRWLGGAGG